MRKRHVDHRREVRERADSKTSEAEQNLALAQAQQRRASPSFAAFALAVRPARALER